MKKPKNLFEAVSRKHMTEEGNLGNPVGAPVRLQICHLNEPHVDNDTKEPFHLLQRHRLPTGKATVSRQVISAPEVSQCVEMRTCGLGRITNFFQHVVLYQLPVGLINNELKNVGVQQTGKK